jgi:maltokinase
VSPEGHEQLAAYVSHARWFGGKGRAFEVGSSRRLVLHEAATEPGDDDPVPTVAVELAELVYADDGAPETYQVPVSYYPGEQDRLAHARIGAWDDDELGPVVAYDALHDHAATPLWPTAIEQGRTLGEVRFVKVGEPGLDTDARSTVFSGQQSNTSVVYGDDSLLKLFRRVSTGVNPDIEVLAALSEAENAHVATLYGYVETDDPASGEVVQLGILQQFLRTASDGWDIALSSLRGLFADGEIAIEDAGGDFSAEAHRLGVAVAEVHATMAEAFPTESWDSGRRDALALAMRSRLDAALAVVPDIEPHAEALRTIFDSVRAHDGDVVAQRVHGDLHLGQTLRTSKNWKIIDFEGEPAKPLQERRRPDSPWRDVAGMLRSFDYAAEMSRLDHEQAMGAGEDDPTAQRAAAWSARNVEAFLQGYREGSGAALDEVLLAAYAADKAVYEAVYEARNRPAWLPIPLTGIARLASSVS